MRRKTIVVTGGTKGIGRAIAEKFFGHNFDLAVCARNNKDLIQFKTELNNKHESQKILAISCDVSDREQVEEFAKQVIYEFGQVHVLVNNAGIFIPGQVCTEQDGVFEQLWQTNVASAYHLTRALLPSLPEHDTAHIFNMCSTASIKPYPNSGTYCISKYALLGMTQVLREELKPKGIKVTAVIPGATLTHSWAGSNLPENRFIEAGEIADSVWACYNMSPRTVVEQILIRPMMGDI